MSRGLSTINEAQVDSNHVHDVTLVKLEFDTPVYVHSGIGTITYGGTAAVSGGNEYAAWKGAVEPAGAGGSGNQYAASKGAVEPAYVSGGDQYLGVGGYGGISATRESEALGPAAITLTLSGVDADYITEALDSGNLYDVVTIYQGLRQDDGTLYDDPWVLWKGWFEYAGVSVGEESAVAITCQHDLSQLTEKDGGRYSDEDLQNAYTGDVGLEYTADMIDVNLVWGGGPVGGGGGRGGGVVGPPIHRR